MWLVPGMLAMETWLRLVAALGGPLAAVVSKPEAINRSKESVGEAAELEGAVSEAEAGRVWERGQEGHERYGSRGEAELTCGGEGLYESEFGDDHISEGDALEISALWEDICPLDRRETLHAGPQAACEAQEGLDLPEHLVMLVHGVSGEPECFKVLQGAMRTGLPTQRTLLVASSANRRVWSHDGVEVCGSRLAEEVLQVIEKHPSLKRISFVAYSIGGLFTRYACGIHYNPDTKKLFGLEACHYLSIATPHLGCHVEGESQVPFLGWAMSIPGMEHLLKPVFGVFAAPVTRLMYGKSGRNLFLEDGDGYADAVIMKLVHDIPGEGFFFSALAEFRLRVCYANAVGDALVGWANASIRRKEDLPLKQCDNLEYMGVVHEAPLSVGGWGGYSHAHAGSSSENSLNLHSAVMHPCMLLTGQKQACVDYMLTRLQTLPWCRIDIAIKNTFLAHTNIIVAKKQFDSIGRPVVEHIAHRFFELEQLLTA